MRKLKIIFLLFLFTLILSLYASSAVVIESKPGEVINAYKNDNLIRLHVVANSNSPRDQYIKRRVREKVLALVDSFAQEETETGGGSPPESDRIERELEKFLREEGLDYETRVKYGRYDFPGRTYGNITLPPDEYRALKVELGRAEGANWWCVLLPPLCTEENIEEKEEKTNKSVTEENSSQEFELEEEEGEGNFEVRFKLAEVISDALENREEFVTFDFFSEYFRES
ncbi:MAG: stage II sporulation protein R [Halanaerobiales bacterium]